jgi:16S rRNA (adenine1518-N6/adenine1519-N6)-dimethyltransferase
VANDDLTSRGTVAALLQSADIRPNKRLGQNFLVNRSVLLTIVSELERDRHDEILEIGAGLGTVTRELAQIASRVVAVEVDHRLIKLLHQTLGGYENVEIVQQDFLKFDLAHTSGDRPMYVVGNIPYRITSPILKHLIGHRRSISRALLLAQTDVVEKIAASPGPGGTPLGILVQAYCDVNIVRHVGKRCFFPAPTVDSTLWRLSFLERPRFSADTATFFRVVRTLYGTRRKMIRRALRNWLPADQIKEVLEEAGIDPTVRGETLTFEDLDRLASAVVQLGGTSP